MSRIRQILSRLLTFSKAILAQTFSTTGLCALVSIYSIFGAFIFLQLESGNEKYQHEIVKEKLRLLQQNIGTELWNNTCCLNVLCREEWINRTYLSLKKYQNELLNIYQNESLIISSNQWSFSGALLYSITVITTIGYGNVTCRTVLGRIATMVYAILGIPLTFLCLANLGTLMANTFRFIYRRILCCPKSTASETQIPIVLVLGSVFVYILLGAFLFSIWENWGILEGAYFCFTTLTTIGFGDFVPGTARFDELEWNSGAGHYKFLVCSAYMLFGLAMISMSFNLVQEEVVNRCKKFAIRMKLLKQA